MSVTATPIRGWDPAQLGRWHNAPDLLLLARQLRAALQSALANVAIDDQLGRDCTGLDWSLGYFESSIVSLCPGVLLHDEADAPAVAEPVSAQAPALPRGGWF
jgi:hypothetical protein